MSFYFVEKHNPFVFGGDLSQHLRAVRVIMGDGYTLYELRNHTIMAVCLLLTLVVAYPTEVLLLGLNGCVVCYAHFTGVDMVSTVLVVISYGASMYWIPQIFLPLLSHVFACGVGMMISQIENTPGARSVEAT